MLDIAKYLIIALIFFCVYNEFVMMHRPSVFNDIHQQQLKDDVINAIVEPKYAYQCGSGQPVSLYGYIENLCIDKVVEVDAFPLCYIYLRCPGWNYIGFDKDRKVVVKYHLDN